MADVLKTLKGAPCRVLNGYTFVFHRYRQGGRILDWRCSKYKSCPTRAVSGSKEGEMTLTTAAPTEAQHTHIADPHSPEKRRRRSALKEAAASNRATPSMSLAAGAHEGLADEAIQSFASQRALQQAVNRVRKIKGAADADKAPDELVLPEEMTRTLREERFLFADTQQSDPGKPRILVFLSDYGIGLLRDNRDWCVDGTFYAAAKHFRQLLTINVLKNESSLPAAYVLLLGSSEEMYDRALDAIFDDYRTQGITPTSFIADFERGLINSMKKRFRDAEEVLCQFHQAKAEFTNIQKKGLLPVYSVPEAKELLRCFMALGYLPTDEVEAGFYDVCQALTALVPSKIPARYKPQLNGWHAALNSLFPKSNLPMSQFFLRIQKEEERTRNLAERNRRNPAEPLRGRRSATSVRENNLVALVEEYADKELARRDRLAYLRLVQAHLSQQAFARLVEQEQAAQNADENTTPVCSQSSSGSQSMELPESSQEILEYMAEAACSISSRELAGTSQAANNASSQCATGTANVSVGPPLRNFSAFNFLE